MTTWICDGCGLEHPESPEPPPADGCIFDRGEVGIDERGDIGRHTQRWTTHEELAAQPTSDGTLLVGDSISGVPKHPASVSFMRNYPKLVPMSPAVVRRIVDQLDAYEYDRLYPLGGDTIDSDAKQVVHRSAERHIRWASGEFDHLT
jgi:hypothetical protein